MRLNLEPAVSQSTVPRQRVLDTAYALFSRRGIGGVELEEVIEGAGVSPEEFSGEFQSKDELVLAFLEQREELWTRGWVEAEARKRGDTSEEQLLAIFDLFHEWFQREDYEGCSFINVLLEHGGREHEPLGRAAAVHLETIRAFIRTLAEEENLRDPAEFASVFHILMKGSIVQASEGDLLAARRARAAARMLIDQHR